MKLIDHEQNRDSATLLTRFYPIIGLIVLSAGIYLPALRYDFVWDDHQFISGFTDSSGSARGLIDDARSAIQGTGYLTYRPIFLISYGIDAVLWGRNPMGFHLTNIVLHVFVTLLVFRFFLEWTESLRTAWFSAAVFTVHPIHTEAVAWIAGRADLWVTLFVLTAFLAVFRSLAPHPAASVMKAWGWALIAGGSFVMALLAKETAIILPVLILAVGYSKQGVSWKAVLPSLLVTVLVCTGYLLLRSPVMITGDSRSWLEAGVAAMTQNSRSWSATSLVSLYVTGEYLRLLLFPVSLKAIYDLPSLTLMDPVVIRSVVILGAWLIGLSIAVRRSSLAASAMAWVLISLVPSYALFIYTSVSPIAERLLYLPSIGFALLCGIMFSNGYAVFRPSRIAQLAIVGISASVLFVYAAGTIYHNIAWTNDEHLWVNTVQNNPQNSLAHFNLATAYFDQKKWPAAIQEYENALSIKPVYPEAHNNVGNALAAQGHLELAVDHYRIAIQQRPDYTDAYINLGVTYHELGREDLAFRALETAVQTNPRSAIAHNDLANVYVFQGEWKKAIEHYERALALRPDYPEARLNLDRARRFDASDAPRLQ